MAAQDPLTLIRLTRTLPRVVTDLDTLLRREEAGRPVPAAVLPDPCEAWLDDHHRRTTVQALLSLLDARSRDVVRRRFGLHDGEQWTLQRIADRYGVTRERIRQLEARAVAVMAAAAASQSWQDAA